MEVGRVGRGSEFILLPLFVEPMLARLTVSRCHRIVHPETHSYRTARVGIGLGRWDTIEPFSATLSGRRGLANPVKNRMAFGPMEYKAKIRLLLAWRMRFAPGFAEVAVA